MRKGREIVGLPVVVLSRGTTVGKVRDLVIDLDRQAVSALSLAESAPDGRARLIPFDSIRGVGRDAVTIEDESAVVTAGQRLRHLTLREGRTPLRGMRVLTEGGSVLGAISDVVVDGRSGRIEEYELSRGPVRDLMDGRTYVSASAPRVMGDEYMVVQEAVVAAGREDLEEGPPLVMEAPPWFVSGAPARDLEDVAADFIARQSDLIVGKRSQRTIGNEDAGGFIVIEGEPITEGVVEKARGAAKLNELVQAAGEAAYAALALSLAERYASVAVGRMAGRTVRTTGGEVVVSQGDVVTPEVVEISRDAGVLDQLMDAVRGSAGGAGGRASRRAAAGRVWDQVAERVGWLTGRR